MMSVETGKNEQVASDCAPPPYIAEETIRRRVRELGREITEELRCRCSDESPLVFISVLKGAFMFTADLVRHVDLPLEVEFVGASSYGNARTSSGEVSIAYGSWDKLTNRVVVVVEDVADSGRTLNTITDMARKHGASHVFTVVLLSKPDTSVRADFTGFRIDGRYVVGYGLDDAGRWRNLPYVGYIDEE